MLRKCDFTEGKELSIVESIDNQSFLDGDSRSASPKNNEATKQLNQGGPQFESKLKIRTHDSDLRAKNAAVHSSQVSK